MGKDKIAISSDRWEELTKVAGQFQYCIVYEYIKEKGKKWPEDANEELNKLFVKFYGSKDKLKKLH